MARAASILLAGLLGAASAAQPAYAQQPFPVAAEPDPVLAQERGGFELPNGIQLAMTVQSQTVVDGHVVLRSVFHLDQGPPTLNVFAPRAGETGPAAASGGGGTAPSTAAPGVSVSLDRTTGMVSVQPNWGSGQGGVSVTNGTAPAGSASDPQLPQVNLGSGPQQTGAGVVSVSPLNSGGSLVNLAGDQIDVSHVFGSAFGSVIANTGNNRSIDTVTSIDLDLRNATPALVGSSLLRAEGLAIDATRGMLR